MSGSSFGKHRPADSVEVARQQVDDVDKPRRKCAELLCTGADAAVDRRGWCRRQVASEATNDVCGDAADRRYSFGGEGLNQLGQRIKAVAVGGKSGRVRQSFVEQDICHGGQ